MKRIFCFWMALLPLLYVACTTPDNSEPQGATYLNVTPSTITFDANGENTFTVDTDGEWIAVATDKITISANRGEAGITPVRVLTMNSTSTQAVVVRTPSNARLAATVLIKPGENSGGGNDDDNDDTPVVPGKMLYYDDLDGDPSYNNWANTSSVWQNPTGEGAANVTYDCYNARMRSDNYGSSGRYTGASGKGYMRIFEPESGSDNHLEVHNIATNGELNFTFSFGAMFQASQCNLYIKVDDSAWKKLDYTASTAYNSWALAKASFTIVGNATKLGFRFEPADAAVDFGYNLDDLRLETSAGGQKIEIETKKSYKWAELPEKNNSKTEYLYHTHWSSSVSSKKPLRNYSYCYDVRRHSPIWIAHPQHAVYEEGGKTRPASDPWARDPYLTDTQSAIIYPIDGRTCSLRTYADDTYTDHYQWGRGHMLPSGYRGCGDRNNPAEINVQTFYSSNVAAQRAKLEVNPDADCAFSQLWGAAERKIQDNYLCADTLYVVSGAHFADENTKAMDANIYYLPSYCKTCVVPTHFYKIVLRTKSGNTGKAIQECSASELKAVGFWFSNTDIDEQTGSATPTLSRAHMRSVAEIEQLTGNEFDFFPEVPDEVKRSYNPTDWGF